jgi:hypothetical protein
MTKPIILFLRPFHIDGKIFVKNPEISVFSKIFSTPFFPVREKVNLEEVILRATEEIGFLLAIGNETNIIGAGKVVTKDNWRQYFMALAHEAVCIFSIPSRHDSTIWELEWLSEKCLFYKVAMIFTNVHFETSHDLFGMSEEDFSKYEIGNLKLVLNGNNWVIPEDIDEGSIVTFGESGVFRDHIKKTKFNKSAFKSIVYSAVFRQKNY